jgi:IS30 family transposase
MKKITFSERKIIEKMLKQGGGVREIARILFRSHSSISDEIGRNKMHYELYYDAELAQARTEARLSKQRNKKIMEKDPSIKVFVVDSILLDQWSPAQIAGQLSLIRGKKVISHETIYQFIYSTEGKQLRLWVQLRRKRKPVRQKQGTRKKRVLIPDRTTVHARPALEFGDCETDLMMAQGKEALSVQVETQSLKCILTTVADKTADENLNAMYGAIEEFGEIHVKSFTYDNGLENVSHTELKRDYSIKTYFCDPYSWWQKGLVENTIGLVRQYLPQYTHLKDVPEDKIYEIQEKLNNRPRKKLGWLTPNQAFLILSQGGRINT